MTDVIGMYTARQFRKLTCGCNHQVATILSTMLPAVAPAAVYRASSIYKVISWVWVSSSKVIIASRRTAGASNRIIRLNT